MSKRTITLTESDATALCMAYQHYYRIATNPITADGQCAAYKSARSYYHSEARRVTGIRNLERFDECMFDNFDSLSFNSTLARVLTHLGYKVVVIVGHAPLTV